nr:hypothetical protein [Tanacetum cinerariifolium]
HLALNVQLSPTKHEQDLPTTSSAPSLRIVFLTLRRRIHLRDIPKHHAQMHHSRIPLHKAFHQTPFPKSSISPPRVNAANPSAVSAARVKAAVSAAKINAVKPSAVTVVQHNHTKNVWRPKTLVQDHAFRTTNASMTLKRFDYNDALGRSKPVMAWVPKRN